MGLDCFEYPLSVCNYGCICIYVQGEKVREKYDIVLKKSFYKYNNLNTCYVLELWVNLFDKVLMFACN